MTGAPPVTHFDVDGRRLACRFREGRLPALLFLPGYASDMDGGKATAIDAFAAEKGLACLRFDYSATGLSDGDFAHGTLETWLEEALALVDSQGNGPVVAIGSSMGGWLALHVALQRPMRVAALLGIAAAPDFTDWGFDEAQRATLLAEGRLEEPNPYGPELFVTHRGFWESGQRLRLLDEAIPLPIPVRLVHGERDTDVPVSVALRTLRQLESGNVQLKLIKNGGHRLSEPNEISAILAELAGLVEGIES